MLAMLRKDLYVLRKYTVTLLIFWTFMAGLYALVPGVDGNMFYAVMPAMTANMAQGAVSNDRVCRWDRFIAMTSLRPWQLVLEKYLLFYGLTALLAALSFLAGWVTTMGRGGLNVWAAVIAVLLFNAMGLPLVYRFGQPKGSTILLSVWGAAAAAILGTAHWRRDLLGKIFGWMNDIPVPALTAGIIVVLLAVNVGSVLLSIRFYARRQRGWYD